MNTLMKAQKTNDGQKRSWPWLLGTFMVTSIAVLIVLGAGVISCFQAGTEARELQQELQKQLARVSGSVLREQISVRIGSVILSLARAGLSFAELNPHARLVLRSIRSADVTVCDLDRGACPTDRTVFLATADEVFCSRGWERVASALDDARAVGVYIDRRRNAGSRMTGCVVAFDEEQIVIACLEADFAPLMEYAQSLWH